MAERQAATFYTVANQKFFVGAVALLNSLRLTGNTGEIVLLDCGLADDQRRRLAEHVTVVDAPPEVRSNPYLIKPFPHHLDPSGVIVIIDSDIVVTRLLDDVVETARQGRICLFAEPDWIIDRFFPEWHDLLGLEAPLRLGSRYRNAGFVVLSVGHWPGFLERWWEVAHRIPSDRMMHAGAGFGDPFWGADQDAMNALLMSELPPDAVHELPFTGAPRERWIREVRVVDAKTVDCELDGARPYLLHYTGSPKPWHDNAWLRVRSKAFETLLTRLLFEPDVPLRLDPSEVPYWLRPGIGPRLALRGLSAVNGTSRAIVNRTSGRTKTRLRALRARILRPPHAKK